MGRNPGSPRSERATTSKWVTRELSPETWPDFVELFSRGNGWDHCACMYFQRGSGMPRGSGARSRAARQVENQRQKHELVSAGRAHGILVYVDAEPVGWCQYGPAGELPCGHTRDGSDDEVR